MNFKRAAGIFLHPTSLPSPFGIGDLGASAYRWVQMLDEAGQSYWQVCPLGPTGYGDSPYQTLCSFAGNTLLLSPVKLMEAGLLGKDELDAFPHLPDTHVDFGRVITAKESLYHTAYSRFDDTPAFGRFCHEQRAWLDDYALFRVIKDLHHGQAWNTWKTPMRLRYPATLEEVASSQRREVRYHKFLQFMFWQQWSELKRYANGHGVRVIGDVPIYVAYDSSDVWSAPHLFELDEGGNPLRVAGVPPDYFSATGQLWGNPLYRWDHMRHDGYAWWISRIRRCFEFFDSVRIDHFRGFEAFWAVAASSPTAQGGEWIKGPGLELFRAVTGALGDVSIIAEDLGEITTGVEEMRKQAGLPGMKVMQFAFDGGPENPYLPYNIWQDSVTYTGTHDNDTSLGWFENLDDAQRTRVCDFLGCTVLDFSDRFMRMAYASPSFLCVIPLQDVLGLDSRHRMNKPGTGEGNWQWRFTGDMVNDESLETIAGFTSIYGRAPAIPEKQT